MSIGKIIKSAEAKKPLIYAAAGCAAYLLVLNKATSHYQSYIDKNLQVRELVKDSFNLTTNDFKAIEARVAKRQITWMQALDSIINTTQKAKFLVKKMK